MLSANRLGPGQLIVQEALQVARQKVPWGFLFWNPREFFGSFQANDASGRFSLYYEEPG